jgi:hypothetical protein
VTRSILLAVIAAFGGAGFAAGLPALQSGGEIAAATAELSPQARPADTRIVEIRAYNLKPGMHDRFRRLFHEQAFPMLQRAQIDVVAFGRSMHDQDAWYLMRAFSSVAERQASEDAFYGSREWVEGPRAAVLDCIDSYTTLVVELDGATIEGLRNIAAGTDQ